MLEGEIFILPFILLSNENSINLQSFKKSVLEFRYHIMYTYSLYSLQL